MYKLDQQASTLAVEYNNRKAFRTMSRAVYEKSVNFVSATLSRVKDNQESFISREPLGIPHRGPVDQRSLEISKDFPRQGCH